MSSFLDLRGAGLRSRPEAEGPAGAKGQFGGFLSRRTEMALPACGAPDGGTARERNHAPQRKERSALTEMPDDSADAAQV